MCPGDVSYDMTSSGLRGKVVAGGAGCTVSCPGTVHCTPQLGAASCPFYTAQSFKLLTKYQQILLFGDLCQFLDLGNLRVVRETL